ncbi:sphingoid base N-palmitoyltransferase [Nematocida homosporus]|uniref:sphingoid base N-palmitoyltransferase n=1 Tax=Nematocida homosporus TaxID=1912981 RepID=UPI002221064F|nr:sphingoid base N-palmitoyltransferase [Nematocida homosporus]KAI5187528.1 sphingoid base N-palmitoyltransferase [Nematocida homosporus]
MRSLASAFRCPADIYSYLIGITGYVICYFLVKRCLAEILIKWCSKVKIGDIPMRKFKRALWKLFCFACMFGWGVYTVWGEDWIYSPLDITFEWPGNRTPWQVNGHYIIETVYYTGSFVTMFLEEKQSDFLLMIWHHTVTLLLMGFSYRYNFLRYGVFVMLLHDISDPWMEAAKIAVYMGYQRLGNVLFVVFTLAFIVPRLFIYLAMIILPGYGFLWEYGSHLLVPIWGLLIAVFLLNCYWSMLILRMLSEFLSRGKIERDIRDLPETTSKGKGKSKTKSETSKESKGKTSKGESKGKDKGKEANDSKNKSKQKKDQRKKKS